MRIIPAFWLALTLAAIYPGITGGWDEHWWGYYLFLQEYVPEWNVGSFQHTWHLSVEIAFYALLPFLVLLGVRLAPRKGTARRSSGDRSWWWWGCTRSACSPA